MECNRWEEEGLLYTSGELSGPESTQYETHLEECESCKKSYSEYMDLVSNVIGDSYPLETFSDEKDQQIKASFQAAAEKKKSTTFIFGLNWVTLLRRTTVALTVVALSYFVTLQVGSNNTPENNQLAGNAESHLNISDSAQPDSLKKFQQGDSKGIKSVNVQE